MKIKDMTTISAKYVNRASAAAADYNAGVQATTGQSAAAIAAIPLWQQAVASAGAAARMSSGLQKAGDQGWKDGVAKKGQANYPNGIRAGSTKYTTNFAPFQAALAGYTFQTAKGIRGSGANAGRSTEVQVLLHTTKLQRSGVTG